MVTNMVNNMVDNMGNNVDNNMANNMDNNIDISVYSSRIENMCITCVLVHLKTKHSSCDSFIQINS